MWVCVCVSLLHLCVSVCVYMYVFEKEKYIFYERSKSSKACQVDFSNALPQMSQKFIVIK